MTSVSTPGLPFPPTPHLVHDGSDAPEFLIQAHCAAGEYELAARHVFRTYADLFRTWCAASVRDRDQAADIYSSFCVRILSALPGYRGRSRFSTWAYSVLRSTVLEHRKRSSLWLTRHTYLDTDGAPEDAAGADLSPAEHDGLFERLVALRSALSHEDELLLTLRVDQGLSWNDIARAYASGSCTAEDVARHSTCLRRRFQRIKSRLRALARQADSEEQKQLLP